ncbi:MAG: hypothetical protein HZB53_09010 [Chloroflexi bacterium]|nr:hypothetical protein [Chloroflexota bacterium]
MLAGEIEAAIAGIAADRQAGAVELADRAAMVIMRMADEWTGDDETFGSALVALCRALVAAQPGMASLLNLCNDVLLAVDGAGVTATVPQRAADAALRYMAFLAHHARRIANEALPYIHSGALLLAHSHSSTVVAALLRAHGAGKRFGVVCTEARPQYDGVQMARRLAAEGIAVEVIADAAAAVFVEGFYTVLVGADAVTPQGIMNKVGTLGMALAARQFGVPFYCFAGTEKFLPAGAAIAIEEKDPAEIVPPEPNLSGYNIYFDMTPLDLVTKVFTEDGPLTPAEVRNRLAATVLHPALRTAPDGARP